MSMTKTISFKENMEDIELYTWLNFKSSPSAFMKDILKNEMKKEKEKKADER